MAGNSESVKRSEKTKKEKYGPDYHARIGATGGRARKRGYFGRLKDEGKLEELKALAKKGSEKGNATKSERAKSKRVSTTVRDTSK